MQLTLVVPAAFVLASLVSALPSNPRTNSFASSNHYSPRDDARMYENRGLQLEGGPRSYNSNPSTDLNYSQGFPPNSPSNEFSKQPGRNYPPQTGAQGNPQGLPPTNEGYRPGSNMSPSFPGIRPHQGTMNSNLIPRPSLGFPSNPSGSPLTPSLDPNRPIDMKPAFEGCDRHDSSISAQQIAGRFETQPAPMKHQSHIAIYPMTDANHAFYVKVLMPSMQYQAKIQGTNVMLEKCLTRGVGCQIENEASTKSHNLIQPQEWNYMYSQIRDGKITIGIGHETKVMTMTNIPAEELDNAEWLISTGPRSTEADRQGSNGGPFIVQFPCAEYVAHHLSSTEVPSGSRTDDDDFSHGPGYTAPIVGYTTEPSKTGGHDKKQDHTAAIVIGVVIALLLIALVVAIAISIHRKRNSMKVNESTPLSDQKKSAATSQEQQQSTQQSQQQEVELHDEK